MATENTRLRNEFINTQVITRNTRKKLGVVKELLVDIDRREVVALGLWDSVLSVSGMPKYMFLDSISSSEDIILVEDEDVIEDIDSDAYIKLINFKVITEENKYLGRITDFQFDINQGIISSLIVSSISLPKILNPLISTYKIFIEEVIRTRSNRLILFEGAEDRINKVTIGLLERLGIVGKPPYKYTKSKVVYLANGTRIK